MKGMCFSIQNTSTPRIKVYQRCLLHPWSYFLDISILLFACMCSNIKDRMNNMLMNGVGGGMSTLTTTPAAVSMHDFNKP
jgi:hypothetical protein